MRLPSALYLLGSLILSAAVARAAGPTPAAASPDSAAAEIAPPSRAKISCAQYRKRVEATAPHAAFNTRLKPGSWGAIPPGLQKLPRGAKLCGSDSRGQVVVASPLFGKDLEAYYAPLFAKLGFAPLACTFNGGQTVCHGKQGRNVGVLLTDTATQTYVLTFMKRERPRTPAPAAAPATAPAAAPGTTSAAN